MTKQERYDAEVARTGSNYGICETCHHMIRLNKSEGWKHHGPGAEAAANHKAAAK